MNPHPTPPKKRSPKSHTSPFQLVLVAMALLGSLVPSGLSSGSRG